MAPTLGQSMSARESVGFDPDMFVQDFTPAAKLAATACPRCGSLGIVEVPAEAYRATPTANQHQAKFIIDPSIPARCPACGLVMEWPGCCE